MVADSRSDDLLVDSDADPDGERRPKAVVDGQPEDVDEQLLDEDEEAELAPAESAVRHECVEQARHRQVRHRGRRAQREVGHVTHRGVPEDAPPR